MLISDDNNNQPYFNPQFNDNNFIISLFRMVFAIDCGLVTKLVSDSFGDSMDSSLSASSVYGVSQARILGWVAICFSRGLNPCLLHCRQIFYH